MGAIFAGTVAGLAVLLQDGGARLLENVAGAMSAAKVAQQPRRAPGRRMRKRIVMWKSLSEIPSETPAGRKRGPAVTQYSHNAPQGLSCIIPEMEQMDIEQEPSRIADVTVFRLKGPFTMSTMFAFQTALRDAMLKGTIIDLEGVPYMDSAGLGVLLGQFAHAQRHGNKFALVGNRAARLHHLRNHPHRSDFADFRHPGGRGKQL